MNFIKRLVQHWKTTSAGLLLIGGSTIHTIYMVIEKTANENTWQALFVAVIGGIGLLVASDGAQVQSNIDQINAHLENTDKIAAQSAGGNAPGGLPPSGQPQASGAH